MIPEPIVEARLYPSHPPPPVVRVDAARHAEQAEHVHREEGQVHADEDQTRS